MSRVVSHYQLEDEIGRGGMGVVYRATDLRLGRPVAIKMLHAAATADPDRHARFVREARTASALNHPHIVTIYEIDEADGVTFIAMELVEGTPLDRLLTQVTLPIAKALDYGAQIAGALAAAHAQGIVHRDIKPANIVITQDGRVKMLDFGVAKLVERAPDAVTRTGLATGVGVMMGTAAYMSPEQAEGRPVDGRSDIFSLGAVLYEMIGGRRPFEADTEIGVITAILRDPPPSLRMARPEVPAEVTAIVKRCLAKIPLARYADALTLRDELMSALQQLTEPDSGWRRPIVLVPLVLVIVSGLAVGGWHLAEARRARWAREQVVPEIVRAQSSDIRLSAVRLARQAEPYAPDEVARLKQAWYRFTFKTTPPGADVAIKDYRDVAGAWENLGQTPVNGVRVPAGYYRLLITKPGYVPLELTSGMLGRPMLTLTPVTAAVPGMVPVPGGPYSIGVAPQVDMPAFWIGRHEVTNREYQRFVAADGYKDPAFWTEPFRAGARVLTFDEAMARFHDTTGRSGPATWELGSYPEGQPDFPVGGVSWYEAAAFARFAGASLPTMYQWYRAAGADENFSDVLRFSNFEGKGPIAVGSRPGFGPWGTTDMAGNVKEWCANLALGTTRRLILGGAWNEPSYQFTQDDAHDPWQREPTFGVRLAKATGPSDDTAIPVATVRGDPMTIVPDGHVDMYRRFYEYDRTPLNARVDRVDESAQEWRKETVSFDAAYGGERVPAFLFLPKNAKPPNQTVVLFPSAYAVAARSSRELDLRTFDFIVRSGRAVLYPVYKGTFERQTGVISGPAALRAVTVQRAQDVFRAVDYLASRPDIDGERLAYYSLSMGAYFGPIPVSLEPRIKVAVFASGGLRYGYPPEVQPANFAPRCACRCSL